MPGVPFDLVKRLQGTRELAGRMAKHCTVLLDSAEQLYQVGRLSSSRHTWKVSLARLTVSRPQALAVRIRASTFVTCAPTRSAM